MKARYHTASKFIETENTESWYLLKTLLSVAAKAWPPWEAENMVCYAHMGSNEENVRTCDLAIKFILLSGDIKFQDLILNILEIL